MTRSLTLALLAAALSLSLSPAPHARAAPGAATGPTPSAAAAVVGALVGASALGSRQRPGLGAAAGGSAPGSVTSGDRSRWRWPVRQRPSVLRPFRAPASDYGAGHRGIDLGIAEGTPVLAVEGGVVTHAGVVAGRGTVTVEHAGGLRSTYEPLDPVVVAGEVVQAGEQLGTLRARDGPEHCGALTCLHLGARRADAYLDPYPLLVRGRLALLPLG